MNVWLCDDPDGALGVAHCNSCHEDHDEYGYDLLSYCMGDVLLHMCCEMARHLGLVN